MSHIFPNRYEKGAAFDIGAVVLLEDHKYYHWRGIAPCSKRPQTLFACGMGSTTKCDPSDKNEDSVLRTCPSFLSVQKF